MNSENKLWARLLRVAPEYVVFELTIVDPTISGEVILPYPQFLDFLKEQHVSLLTESEDERVLWMQLTAALERHNLSLPT